jgi:hypothetical protein
MDIGSIGQWVALLGRSGNWGTALSRGRVCRYIRGLDLATCGGKQGESMRDDGIRMLRIAGLAVAGWMAVACGTAARAQTGDITDRPFSPVSLSLQPNESESVYAPPESPREGQGVNEGAVHFDLGVGYSTDYVYRGIELLKIPAFIHSSDRVAGDSPNLQINTKLSWDTGMLPHPFISVFVNYADSDPVSSFQEVRPVVGVEWTLRPFVLSAGHNLYIYPDRDEFETSEFWGRIELDDSYFLRTERPVFSPYIYGAYDYDRYNGWYFEAGVSHGFVIEDTGLTLTANAHASYVQGIDLFGTVPNQHDVSGFQHYQLGLIADYSLNKLLNFSARYGQWSLQGFVYYTDGLDNDLRSTTQLWGGAGIIFRY